MYPPFKGTIVSSGLGEGRKPPKPPSYPPPAHLLLKKIIHPRGTAFEYPGLQGKANQRARPRLKEVLEPQPPTGEVKADTNTIVIDLEGSAEAAVDDIGPEEENITVCECAEFAHPSYEIDEPTYDIEDDDEEPNAEAEETVAAEETSDVAPSLNKWKRAKTDPYMEADV